MLPRRLRIATRGSRLAIAQTDLAAAALRANDPGIEIETVEVLTQGDRDRTSPLAAIGGQGVFVAAVREAVLDGRADIAVHSLKDVPTTMPDGLIIAAMLERADPSDCLVAAEGRRLPDLPPGARVGTSSSRRAALLRAIRPDIQPAEIRGNVDTRIQKVRDGEYDAALLASAGLDRLGRSAEATQRLDPAAFPCSPGQGVIAIECRSDDEGTRELLAQLDHADTRFAAEAERGVLAALGTGCNLPVGAYAHVDASARLTLHAFVAAEDGSHPVFGRSSGPVAGAEALGRALGERLRATVEAGSGASS
jgi:hydroxymethylbilane synthase